MIEGPARLAGIDDRRRAGGAAGRRHRTGAALPLLAYTLAQLADGLARGGRAVGGALRQLGGVHGTLSRQADAALADAVAASGRQPSDR